MLRGWVLVEQGQGAEGMTHMRQGPDAFDDIGAALGGYLTGALIDWSGYGAGFGAMAVVALAGGLLMLATPKAS